jgi:hypothetical protein
MLGDHSTHTILAKIELVCKKVVGVLPDEPGTEACRFCGSNTVPPDLMTELQSGALPSELKRLKCFDKKFDAILVNILSNL